MSDPLIIANWALVGVTLVYVVLTGLILLQNAKLIAGQTRPDVIAYVEGNEKHAIFLVVENAGPGVAKDVSVDVPEEWSANESLGNLGRIGFVAKGISILPPGRRVHSFIAIGADINKEALQPFVVRLTFSDTAGKRHSSECPVDLSEMSGIRASDHAAPGNLVGAR